MDEELIGTTELQKLNPFTDSLLRPRETIRYVQEHIEDRYFFILLYLYGLLYVMSAVATNVYDFDILTIGLMLIVAPISGVIQLYVSGWAFFFVGELFGGYASSVDIRRAILWSSVPQMYLLPISFITFILGARNIQTVVSEYIFIFVVILFIALIELVFGIWCYVNMLRMISEFQGFSTGKAFLSTLIPGLIIGALLFIVLLLVVLL